MAGIQILLEGPGISVHYACWMNFCASMERQIHDPLKRLLFQHNLWAVFDRSAEPYGHPSERRELQIRLAEVLRRLALTEMRSPRCLLIMPLRSHRENSTGSITLIIGSARSCLPIYFNSGPWVLIRAMIPPAAEVHAYSTSGRSSFFIFLRLRGRQATLDYLTALWNAPDPWIRSVYDRGETRKSPQFPVGTEVALLRQMNAFDRDGNLVAMPITESLQVRVFHKISGRLTGPTSSTGDARTGRTGCL